MPKLDTTVNNVELTVNRITMDSPNANWTDTQYPSAKTVYEAYNNLNNKINAVHPVGSVLCMSTNTNPSTTLGGTWTLIDKEFRQTWIDLTASDWTASAATFHAGCIALYGKTGLVRLSCIPTATFGDGNPTTMGKINWSNYGLGETYFSCAYQPAQGDGANSSVVYTLTTDGTINCYDALNVDGSHSVTVNTGYDIYFTNYVTWAMANMPDNYCDKFYFKRTA